MHPKPLALLAAATATLAGCGNPFEICTTEAVPALSVTVVDSIAGANLAPEALVWASDGAFVDTLQAFVEGVPYVGAFERAGRYTVVAELEGFETWSRENVLVEDDGCHVATREVTARLAPAGGT